MTRVMENLRRKVVRRAIALSQEHQRRQTLRKLNQLYTTLPSQAYPVLSQMQFKLLSPEDW
jgi:hypothetical protein